MLTHLSTRLLRTSWLSFFTPRAYLPEVEAHGAVTGAEGSRDILSGEDACVASVALAAVLFHEAHGLVVLLVDIYVSVPTRHRLAPSQKSSALASQTKSLSKRQAYKTRRCLSSRQETSMLLFAGRATSSSHNLHYAVAGTHDTKHFVFGCIASFLKELHYHIQRIGARYGDIMQAPLGVEGGD